MKRTFTIISTAVLLSACAATAEKGITVSDAWIRPTAPGENGAVYFVIQNHSSDDELVSVTADIAESAEIHESMMMAGDVMEMGQVDSVPLSKDSEVIFEPGGLHVMLVYVKKELMVGETIEVTLHFKNHADFPVNVSVAESAPTGE
jgi:copper(I)-binding protein